jgi:hypothetical protein
VQNRSLWWVLRGVGFLWTIRGLIKFQQQLQRNEAMVGQINAAHNLQLRGNQIQEPANEL